VVQADQRVHVVGDDAQFLGQFAHQRRMPALAGLALAAGKLPQAALMRALRTALDEHPAGAIDQHAGDHVHARAGQLR
jgi:hypothetical protein